MAYNNYSYDDVDLAEREREIESAIRAREEAREMLKAISDSIIDDICDLHLGEYRVAAVDRAMEKLAELRHYAIQMDSTENLN